jgi:hypothetical protein
MSPLDFMLLSPRKFTAGAEHDTRPRVRGVQKRTDAVYGRVYPCRRSERKITMLMTLLVVLLVLWLVGVGTSYTLGGFVHILLVIALVVVVLRVIQGRNPISG